MKHTLIRASLVALAFGAVNLGHSAIAADGDADTTEDAGEPLKNRELPPGPNFDLYKASCLGCHDSSYVIKTKKSPRTFWEAEVKKMVELYDAAIRESDQKLIVDYLMSVRGSPGKPAK